MIYGKLTDVGLQQAPNPLLYNSRIIYNPSGDRYLAAGYLPVETAPMPDDGAYYAAHWAEQEGKIVQVWTEIDPPVTDEDILTPAQQREAAYNTAPAIQWGGTYLTVTQAAQQWAYYAAEGDAAKTEALTALIAQAKAEIRAQWPEEGGS